MAPGIAWLQRVAAAGDGWPPLDVARLTAARSAEAWSPATRFARVFGHVEPREPLSEDALLARVAAVEGLVTQLMAAQGQDLLELRERRLTAQRAGQAGSGDEHDPEACGRGCCDPDGWIALEAAQAMAVSQRQVDTRIETAMRLDRFGALGAAVEQGRVQSFTASKLAEHLAELAMLVPDERLRDVERATVAWLLDRTRTVGQLNARMRRIIIAARSEAGRDQLPEQAPDRRVWVSPPPCTGDGLATLSARLPEADAVAIRSVLGALAVDPAGAGDERTRMQRRCDLLTAMITGAPARHGHPDDVELIVRDLAGMPVHVQIHVSADTLTGGSEPGEVPGYGSLPASVARDLAMDATRCRGLDITRTRGDCSASALCSRPRVASPAPAGRTGCGCAGSTTSRPPAGMRTRR